MLRAIAASIEVTTRVVEPALVDLRDQRVGRRKVDGRPAHLGIRRGQLLDAGVEARGRQEGDLRVAQVRPARGDGSRRAGRSAPARPGAGRRPRDGERLAARIGRGAAVGGGTARRPRRAPCPSPPAGRRPRRCRPARRASAARPPRRSARAGRGRSPAAPVGAGEPGRRAGAHGDDQLVGGQGRARRRLAAGEQPASAARRPSMATGAASRAGRGLAGAGSASDRVWWWRAWAGVRRADASHDIVIIPMRPHPLPGAGRRKAGGGRFPAIIRARTAGARSTAGRPALHGREPGQVRKEAATAILCKCRGNGSPPLCSRPRRGLESALTAARDRFGAVAESAPLRRLPRGPGRRRPGAAPLPRRSPTHELPGARAQVAAEDVRRAGRAGARRHGARATRSRAGACTTRTC